MIENYQIVRNGMNIREILLSGIVVLLIIPVQIPINIFGGAGYSRISQSYASINGEDVLLLFIFFITIFNLVFHRKIFIRWTKLSLIYFVISIWIGFTVVNSFGYSVHLAGETSILWYLKWLEIFVFFILIQDIIYSPNIAERLFQIFFWVSNIASITLALWGAFTSLESRLTILYNNPNAMGVFMSVISIVDTVILLTHTSNIRKMLSFIGLSSAFVNIFLTGSRTALITAGIALCITLILVFLSSKKKILLLLSFLVLFIAMTAIVKATIPRLGHRHISRWFELGRVFLGEGLDAFWQTKTLQIRFSGYKYGLDLFRSSPIIGHGYFITGDLDNLYLSLLAETGIVGFLLFMSMVFLMLQIFWKQFKKSKDRISIIGISIIFSFLISSLPGRIMLVPRFQFLLILFLSFSKPFQKIPVRF